MGEFGEGRIYRFGPEGEVAETWGRKGEGPGEYQALDAILAGADRIVQVSDDEVKSAMRDFYRCTHNLAEGAGAAPFAALMKDKDRKGKRVAVILSGGNIDREMYLEALGG